MHKISGEFDIQLEPRDWDHQEEDGRFSRLAMTKTFRGSLVGSSSGQMLAWGGPPSPSGAYVAIERFSGTLQGRDGSFVLQHRGVMGADGQTLEVTIVPESGTGDLEGIEGTMTIQREGSQHRYELDYRLPG
ncbi:hypothetical protein ABI59_06515 [Acidobacteria bacterium Mor1]|nr:hypothetical protein ABI59_06515 [Acidobacteria bacterium Mor1]